MPPHRFTAVDFPTMHPSKSVADHEVLMAFHGDSDAAAFYEWWGEQGSEVFAVWLKRRKQGQEFPAADFGELKDGPPLNLPPELGELKDGPPLTSPHTCPECGGPRAHFRLKGYRCLRCD